MSEKVDLEGIVAKYVELRDRRSALKAHYEAEDLEHKNRMEKIEAYLNNQMSAMGVESLRTSAGTAFRTYKEFVSVADWTCLLGYIKENDRFDLLERRVSKSTTKEIMAADANGSYTNPPPPGVNFVREQTVQIRRS